MECLLLFGERLFGVIFHLQPEGEHDDQEYGHGHSVYL